MGRSYYTRSVKIDSGAIARVLQIAAECDVYESQTEAQEDNWQEVLDLLCDEFEEDTKVVE